LFTVFDTLSLTLRDELRFGMFKNRVLRRVFGPKREELVGAGEDCIMRSFITWISHQYLIKEDGMGRACSTDGRDEKCIQYFGWKT